MQKIFTNITGCQALIITIIIAGVFFRVGHLLFVPLDVPFRLGGLYLEFSNQIIGNHFRLPINIPYYSVNGLPFAYPPFAFYIQAIFIALVHPPKFLTVNLIPPVVAALSVPSFYYLAKQVSSNKIETIAILTAYVFIPNTFFNQIEAAGLSEAFGELFLIWYSFLLLKVYRQPNWLRVFLAGLFLALCILSSPGSALAAPIISLLFALYMLICAKRQHSFTLVYAFMFIGLTGAALSAPYWVYVMVNHGRGIFLNTLRAQLQTGSQSSSFIISSLYQLLTFNFGGAKYSFLWDSLIFLGLIESLTSPAIYLGILFIILSLVPREGAWLGAIVAAILAGKGLVRYVIPVLRDNIRAFPPRWAVFVKSLVLITFLAVISYNTVEGVNALIRDRQWYISADEVTDLEQYSQVIPQNAKVIVIGNDALNEWSPQLLSREVINTSYGLEWEPGDAEKVRYINNEIAAAKTIDDVLNTGKYYQLTDLYLVGSKDRISKLLQSPSSNTAAVDMLVDGRSINILHLYKK